MKIKELSLGRFNNMKDLENFVNKVSTLKSDVRVISEKYDIDAKSLLGMMTMMHQKNIRVAFAYSNQAELNSTCELLSAWAA